MSEPGLVTDGLFRVTSHEQDCCLDNQSLLRTHNLAEARNPIQGCGLTENGGHVHDMVDF